MTTPDQPADPTADQKSLATTGEFFRERVQELAAGTDVGPVLDPAAFREVRLRLYEDINRQINALRFGKFAHFMNFGYEPTEAPTYAAVIPSEADFDRASRRLILEVLGDWPLAGKDVLDVSCGRGALAVVLAAHFAPGSYLGIDFSSAAVAFCQDRHRFASYAFKEGNAEALPVEAASIDVVVNVEASHLYFDIGAFHREVHRVLRPGGLFLYADVLSPATFAAAAGTFAQLGMATLRETDITPNVLASCRESAPRRLRVYSDPSERALMAEFLAAPGSEMFERMADGSLSYRIYALRKAP